MRIPIKIDRKPIGILRAQTICSLWTLATSANNPRGNSLSFASWLIFPELPSRELTYPSMREGTSSSRVPWKAIIICSSPEGTRKGLGPGCCFSLDIMGVQGTNHLASLASGCSFAGSPKCFAICAVRCWCVMSETVLRTPGKKALKRCKQHQTDKWREMVDLVGTCWKNYGYQCIILLILKREPVSVFAWSTWRTRLTTQWAENSIRL